MQMQRGVFFCCLFLSVLCAVSGENFSWKSADVAAQADKTTCKPLQKYESAALKNTNNAKDVQRTSLGAVDNAEICGGLCCEMENCDLAEFNKLKQCYAIQCNNLKNCDIDSNGDATVLTFSRKTGSDVWTRSFKSQQASKPIADLPTSSMMEQHPTASNTVNGVQKSQIPDDNASKKSEEVDDNSITDMIIKAQNTQMKFLTQQLENTDKLAKQAEEEFKSKENSKKTNIAENEKLGKEISSITGQHYLKTDDKDITSFQENDTSIAHTKHQHKHDIRHNIISPITIGAFTCMAVIAVSGFAMAIIKYKKERREGVDDKQTQSP